MVKQILVIFLALATLFITLPAFAKGKLPGGNFSELRAVNTSKVANVIDPQTIQLEDKRIIRLSGVEFPDLSPYTPGPFSAVTLKILKSMLEGKTVNVYQTKDKEWGRANRMNQLLAHLEIQKGGVWVQGALLSLGLARVMTDESNPEMATQMYLYEDMARHAKAGLWALEKYKVLTPLEALDHAGGFGIVEGKIASVAMRQNRIYLNFGQNWKSDFTVSIAPENRRRFFDRNIDPMKWNGKVIRVRGWIGNYNGAVIDVDHPEQIEVLPEPVDPNSKELPLKTPEQPPMLKSTTKN